MEITLKNQWPLNLICVESYLQGNTYYISSFASVEKL